jgi:aryl-alcohol dehydrogenase-like predicted oxidoreductase
MEYRQLGNSNIQVSLICLGTMTWGEQNTLEDGFAQMDYALDQGINFFDTAEMYSVPPKPETYGRTEEIIGEWFQSRKTRDRVVLASKVAGKTSMDWVRNGQNQLDRPNITKAVEDSLKRLKTDYIDLYQLHWPDRPNNRFGKLGFSYAADELPPNELEKMHEVLTVLGELVEAGKIRTVGLSNESPWGVMTYLHLAEKYSLPQMVSIQNAYNLLNRKFEVGLSEIAVWENCGLLAYSPLAAGTLTGKYAGGQIPPGSRRSLDSRPSRYETPRAESATKAYLEVAKRHNLDPAQMALAFINQQPFLTSNIIGATSMEQLKTNIGSINVKLSEEALADIEAVHQENPNPCP